MSVYLLLILFLITTVFIKQKLPLKKHGNVALRLNRALKVSSPEVFLDGFQLSDLSILHKALLSVFKTVQINKTLYGAGMRGQDGFVNFFSRTKAFDNKFSKIRNTKSSTNKIKNSIYAG